MPGHPLYLAQLGEAYGLVGRTEEARGVLRRLEEMSGERYVSPYHMAYVYTGLGEQDTAIAFLERGLRGASRQRVRDQGVVPVHIAQGAPEVSGVAGEDEPRVTVRSRRARI